MFCRHCQRQMRPTVVGHSKCTVEMWACPDRACGFTFEVRTDTRGFYFCFPEERSSVQTRPETQAFPHRVFEIGQSTSPVGTTP